jgi:hypothetical protein
VALRHDGASCAAVAQCCKNRVVLRAVVRAVLL